MDKTTLQAEIATKQQTVASVLSMLSKEQQLLFRGMCQSIYRIDESFLPAFVRNGYPVYLSLLKHHRNFFHPVYLSIGGDLSITEVDLLSRLCMDLAIKQTAVKFSVKLPDSLTQESFNAEVDQTFALLKELLPEY